jgi:hypothetical protein
MKQRVHYQSWHTNLGQGTLFSSLWYTKVFSLYIFYKKSIDAKHQRASKQETQQENKN